MFDSLATPGHVFACLPATFCRKATLRALKSARHLEVCHALPGDSVTISFPSKKKKKKKKKSVRELTAAILLAADDRGWPLDDALRPLWLRLRLATLWHLW